MTTSTDLVHIKAYDNAHGESLNDLKSLATSNPSLKECLAVFVAEELARIEESFSDVLTHTLAMSLEQDTFKTSRQLRNRTRRLKEDLDAWNDTPNASAHMPNELKRASEVMQWMVSYEHELQDAYQIFVNSATLLDARKDVQMAEKSIEMSEMSIRESERVRIRKSASSRSCSDCVEACKSWKH